MTSNDRVAFILAVLLVIYIVSLRAILWRFLGPFARKTLVAVTLVVIVWGLFNCLTRWDRTFWGWLFASNNELAFGAMMSSLMLMLAGLVALINAWRPVVLAARLPWLVLAAAFLFMGLDEYYAIHESSDVWNTLYTFNGVILVLMGAAIFAFERDVVVPLFLVIGVGMLGFGGVVLDEFSNEVPISLGVVELSCTYKIQGIFCTDLSIVEELFELGGATMILVGFVAFAEKRQSAPRWTLARRALAALTVFWMLWMLSHVWLVPTAEARLMAEPAKVEYLDGAIRLESYDLSSTTAAPGDTVDVTLFFRAGELLSNDYYLSVHLLSHPDVQSIAQSDVQLGGYDYPTSAWLPFASVKTVVHLTLPRDLPQPASYWVMARIWQGPGLEHRVTEPITPETGGPPVPITASDRRQLAPDTVVLDTLAVPGDHPTDAPPTEVEYRFANGLRLYGVDLPTTGAPGDSLTVRFWWKADHDIGQNLVQFLHFYPADSSGAEFFTFDGEPFGGRFPFADWHKGTDVLDTRAITLPAEMPPGDYRVHTGVYDPNTGIRVPIEDANGDPVQDQSIYLGDFTVR